MVPASKILLLLAASALLVGQIACAAPAVAPTSSGKTSACALPNGVEVQAPESNGTAQHYYYYYYNYSWSYYSSYYYRYYWGRKLLQNVGAPAPSSAPACCPTTTTKQGDTVSSLILAAGLPEDSKVFFYTLNPSVRNGTESLPAGTTVTVPCFRITEFYRLAAGNAQAPATNATPAATSTATTG